MRRTALALAISLVGFPTLANTIEVIATGQIDVLHWIWDYSLYNAVHNQITTMSFVADFVFDTDRGTMQFDSVSHQLNGGSISASITVDGIDTYGDGVIVPFYTMPFHWTSGNLYLSGGPYYLRWLNDGSHIEANVGNGFHQLYMSEDYGFFQDGTCPGHPCGHTYTGVNIEVIGALPTPGPMAGDISWLFRKLIEAVRK
jgi:hypothetical protein